jgi:hypothetical protein
MRVSRELKLLLIAGGIVGLLGVAAFGLVHAIIIFPIWRRLLGGLPFGIVGGIVMGWALYELRVADRPATAWNGLAFGLLLWLTLFPMTMFGVMIRATGFHGEDDSWEVVVELLLAFGAGALAGWLFGRRWRAALAVGAATLGLALAMGGPIAVTNSARSAQLFASFGILYPLSGLALMVVKSAIFKRLRSPA